MYTEGVDPQDMLLEWWTYSHNRKENGERGEIYEFLCILFFLLLGLETSMGAVLYHACTLRILDHIYYITLRNSSYRNVLKSQ